MSRYNFQNINKDITIELINTSKSNSRNNNGVRKSEQQTLNVILSIILCNEIKTKP